MSIFVFDGTLKGSDVPGGGDVAGSLARHRLRKATLGVCEETGMKFSPMSSGLECIVLGCQGPFSPLERGAPSSAHMIPAAVTSVLVRDLLTN